MRFSGPLLLALALTAGFARPSAAQTPASDVTTADIQRLQDSLNEASRDITQARTVFEWGPQPRPGQRRAGQAATASKRARASRGASA